MNMCVYVCQVNESLSGQGNVDDKNENDKIFRR